MPTIPEVSTLIRVATPTAGVPESSTIIGIVGTALTGSPSVAAGTPSLISTLDEARTKFGDTGTLIESYELIRDIVNVHAVGVWFDNALTGSPRDVAVTTAIDALKNVPGYSPTIIIVPGETYNTNGAASTIAAKMNTVAESLLAIAIGDGPRTKADFITWNTNNGNERIFGVPERMVTPAHPGENIWGSAYIAAHMAYNDAERGLRDNPLLEIAPHITSVDPEWPYSVRDKTLDASVLYDHNATMVVRNASGHWVVLGYTTKFADGTDPRAEVTTHRIVDEIEGTLQAEMEKFLGANLDAGSIDQLAARLNGIITGYIIRGDITAGSATPDSVFNTDANLRAHKVGFVIDLTMTGFAKSIQLTINI